MFRRFIDLIRNFKLRKNKTKTVWIDSDPVLEVSLAIKSKNEYTGQILADQFVIPDTISARSNSSNTPSKLKL